MNNESRGEHPEYVSPNPSLPAVCEDERFPQCSIQPSPAVSLQVRRRAFLIRILALLCTCSLSVGSHYASYVLGPLKSRFLRDLGSSNTEFGLLISALSLNSTWTPLVGGVMANRLGTTFASIFATGIIFLGTVLLLLGENSNNIRLMALGMFVFGLGISPLSVVQETIIVRFFKSHGLGFSMALGLIAGKGAAFLSVRTSYPLVHHFGPSAPFYVATFLAAFSVVVNLVYIFASKWLVQGANDSETLNIGKAARCSDVVGAQSLEKRDARGKVRFTEISQLGDIFWIYAWINILAGTLWTPFTHLAANIIERRYGVSEGDATRQASYLLAGSIVLYPVCGYLIDRQKKQPIIMQLFMLSSLMTLCCYSWLLLPPRWTRTALPAVAAFGGGYGISPLIVVLLAPHIVPVKYVSTVLAVHKSLEQTGSTIFQTLAGLSLDVNNMPTQDARKDAPIQFLLNTFVVLNLLQLCSILGMAQLDRQHRQRNAPTNLDVGAAKALDNSTIEGRLSHEGRALLSNPRSFDAYPQYSSACSWTPSHPASPADTARECVHSRNGEIFVRMCGALIIFAWVLFLMTAWLRLRSREERGC